MDVSQSVVKSFRVYKRCLRVVYNDGHSSYDELLNLGNTVSRHPKNLQNQAMIMFRVYTGINLRNQQEFTVRPMKTWIEFFGIFRAKNMGIATK